MTEREARPSEPEPEVTSLDEVRCPECESEDSIEHIEHPYLPPDRSGYCTACDHRAHPLAFHHSWKWERMSEDEREQAREARERYESEMAEHQHSTVYLAERREP